MPELKLIKLYRNTRDFEVQHMLYKTLEGLQAEAFDLSYSYLSDHEIEYKIAIEDNDEYFVINGGYYHRSSVGE